MQLPTVANQLNDPTNDVKYVVLAYRTLTKAELMQSVGAYLRSLKGKKPKRGSRIQITSIIGFDGT